jgi:hypothetical protein
MYVPDAEDCLPAHIKTKRMLSVQATQRTVAVGTKRLKVSPWMDLHTFRLAAEGISVLYQHDEALSHSYQLFITRLSAFWTQLPCTALMQYEQAVREQVALAEWDSFDCASVNDHLWLELLHPHMMREALLPQPAHMLQQRIPAEACCYAFNSSTCTSKKRHCDNGIHACNVCGRRNDSATHCVVCHRPLPALAPR